MRFPLSFTRGWQRLGPGFVVAATGVGAGDLIAAAVAGQQFGLPILWAVLLGAVFKAVLNEGISRWQLATGTTLVEGWRRHLPRFVSGYFLLYLVLWGFLVAAALVSACGVAAHALFPGLSVPVWAILHALAGLALVWTGRYRTFESVMKALIALMFIVVLLCAAWMGAPAGDFVRGLFVPRVPEGSARFLLGVIGGVGGSATLLCYGYWIRERGWRGPEQLRRTWWDLGSAYALTGLFGLAIIVIAAGARPGDASGQALLLALAERLGTLLGPTGEIAFLIGFWCAVFTSLLGVWQGVPYLFADFVTQWRDPSAEPPGSRDPLYRAFLLYLALPPLTLLFFQRPLAIVILYAIAGAFFMPFLASVLLVMNNRKAWVGSLRNGWMSNGGLAGSLVLFGALFVFEVWERFGG